MPGLQVKLLSHTAALNVRIFSNNVIYIRITLVLEVALGEYCILIQFFKKQYPVRA